MKIAVKSVKTMALESGIPEETLDRHIDAFCEMALRLRTAERTVCKNKVRGWYFSKDISKPQLFEVLEDH
jgi:hypothetical protein